MKTLLFIEKKKIFKAPKKILNNSLNLLHSENENIFNDKIENENKKLIEKGKSVKKRLN